MIAFLPINVLLYISRNIAFIHVIIVLVVLAFDQFVCHFKGQTVSMSKVALHIFLFWAPQFFTWILHFGWIPRFN